MTPRTRGGATAVEGRSARRRDQGLLENPSGDLVLDNLENAGLRRSSGEVLLTYLGEGSLADDAGLSRTSEEILLTYPGKGSRWRMNYKLLLGPVRCSNDPD